MIKTMIVITIMILIHKSREKKNRNMQYKESEVYNRTYGLFR